MRKGAVAVECAGRSLSYAHGSVLVPIVNSPPSTSTSGGSTSAVGRRSCRGVPVGIGRRFPGHQLQGGQEGLVVLVLVLHDHAVDEAVGEQGRARIEGDPVEHVEHALADVGVERVLCRRDRGSATCRCSWCGRLNAS